MAITDDDVANFAASGQWRCTVEEVQDAAVRLLMEKRMPSAAVTDAVWNGVNAAVRAMVRLDAGQGIASGSPEHVALVWAVLRLVSQNLIDHRPLTDAQRAVAADVVKRLGIRE